ncbi:hypothetical protein HELRODRAFT_101454 [Helobdella robusta]|uniref:Dihydroorotate dehydrogenase (quinone), mitochondrial n=1 Tax=Helobdella robusta TaxID=6412 RepID=T1ED46_HELRO|nr:hypothetical protein HELRODRAFT_101454 [Helobdella robusta]ESN99829.1 hypothetical protein HELRODRAFT_101454 [Helobdella robusta]
MNRAMNKSSRLKSAIQVFVGGHIVAASMATYWGNDAWYRNVIMPIIHATMDGEKAHKTAIWFAKHGLVPRVKVVDHPELKSNLWGMEFTNPIGLAAGFDKDGEAVDGLLKMGFGFVEVGSVTPEPQPGNPQPRVFRLKEDSAIINRYGFNSSGHNSVLENLKKSRTKSNGIVGINLGKNKMTEDESDDYIKGIVKFSQRGQSEEGPPEKSLQGPADYLVVNISSPNTPGLRSLQGKAKLEKLLQKIVDCRNSLPADSRRPLLVKLSPDLTADDMKDVAEVVLKPKFGVDGLIISNTTVDRSMKLLSSNRIEVGGLSGEPLKDISTNAIKRMYLLTSGKLPIIGVGGVSSGEDAYKKIRAGASLVQIYSALALQGPSIVARINNELSEILKKEGVTNVADVIGIDARKLS